MCHDVFISHSSKDRQVANAVVHWLEAAGIRCWIAPRDVPGGINYSASIVRAIKSSRSLVLILTDAANHSGPVAGEVEQAVRQGVPIVPFRVEDIEPCPEIMLHIGSIHWLDAISPPLETHLDKLVKTVRVFLDVIEDAPKSAERSDIETLSQAIADPGRQVHTEAKRSHIRMLGWLSVPAISALLLILVMPWNSDPNEAVNLNDDARDQAERDRASIPVADSSQISISESIQIPLSQITIFESSDHSTYVIRGVVLNEDERQLLVSTMRLQLDSEVIDEVSVDADRVRSMIHDRLVQSGIKPTRVLVRHRPNWGSAYLDIRVPGDAVEKTKQLVSEFLLDSGLGEVTAQP